MTKQSTLFQETEPTVLAELDFAEAEKLAQAIKAAVEAHCDKIEIAGSIRRQKPKVHDIDFVVVAKTDSDWQRINEVLRRLKAKPNCSGNQLKKAYMPCQSGLFQVDFYRAKPSTFGIHLLIRTGSADHNMWLAGYAISKGMRLKYSEGLIKDVVPIAGEDEKGVFSALGLSCPLPTEREIVDGKPIWMPKE
jgi:DNA polymerase/3'-5' exonuclease PolX